MADTVNSIEDVLKRDGVWVSTTAGTSMWPMLRDRRDTVIVKSAKQRLHPLDIALYRRGDAYILHRVIAVTENGYRIIGDNCIAYENVPESAVIGYLDTFWRDERCYNPRTGAWHLYARIWHALLPARRAFKRARAVAGRLVRMMGLR